MAESEFIPRNKITGKDDMITRIMEIERRCSADVERAELECAKKVEARRRFWEEKRIVEHARILAEGKNRLEQAVEEAKTRAENASHVAEKQNESLFQDPGLKDEVKRKIISILLES